MTTKTIRRGTKLFDKAIDTVNEITAYDLSNGFQGKKCIVKKHGWTLRRELELAKHAILSTHNGAIFTLRSHSNLWFVWEI